MSIENAKQRINGNQERTRDYQTRINEIEKKSAKLRKIAEEAAKTGQLPDFGRPYEELTGIERQLYDIALSRQALEKRIFSSCERLNKQVGNLYESSETLTEQLQNIDTSANQFGKKLSKNLQSFFSKIFHRFTHIR